MLNLLNTSKPTKRDVTSAAVSAGMHVLVVLALVGAWRASKTVVVTRLPGTAQGTRLLTYYETGSPPHAVSDLPEAEKPKPEETSKSHLSLPVPVPKAAPAAAPATDDGVGTSQQNGRGDGDINIALQTVHPYPKPDLSVLPHGARGDVVLDAVIDEKGKIASLKVLRSLGQAIDDTVIATVKGWEFSPATRNGVPIASEQELHFHYERA